MKKVYAEVVFNCFNPLIFFKTVFRENYDRYEVETFRGYLLWYDLSIGVTRLNVDFHHGKMVCPIFKHVSICFNG